MGHAGTSVGPLPPEVSYTLKELSAPTFFGSFAFALSLLYLGCLSLRCFVSAAVCLAHGCRSFVFATCTTHASEDCRSSLTQIFGGVSAPSLPFALCTFALVCSVLLYAARFRFAPVYLLFLCSTLCCSTFCWSVGVRTEPVAQMY